MFAVVVTQMQITSCVIVTISWTDSVSPFFIFVLENMSLVFSLDMAGALRSPECTASAEKGMLPLDRWWVSMVLPWVLCCLPMLWLIAAHCFYGRWNAVKRRKTSGTIVRAGMQVLLLGVYKTIMEQCFRIFQCGSKIPKIDLTLPLDSMNPCVFSGQETADVGAAVTALLVAIFYGAFTQFFLVFKLGKAWWKQTMDDEILFNPSFKSRYGWAAERYKVAFAPFWELFHAITKTGMVIGTSLFADPRDPHQSRTTFHIVFAVIALLMHMIFRPYRDPAGNLITCLFLICNIFGIMAAGYDSARKQQEFGGTGDFEGMSAFAGKTEADIAQLQSAFVLLVMLIVFFVLGFLAKSSHTHALSAKEKRREAVMQFAHTKGIPSTYPFEAVEKMMDKEKFQEYSKIEWKLLGPFLFLLRGLRRAAKEVNERVFDRVCGLLPGGKKAELGAFHVHHTADINSTELEQAEDELVAIEKQFGVTSKEYWDAKDHVELLRIERRHGKDSDEYRNQMFVISTHNIVRDEEREDELGELHNIGDEEAYQRALMAHAMGVGSFGDKIVNHLIVKHRRKKRRKKKKGKKKKKKSKSLLTKVLPQTEGEELSSEDEGVVAVEGDEGGKEGQAREESKEGGSDGGGGSDADGDADGHSDGGGDSSSIAAEASKDEATASIDETKE